MSIRLLVALDFDTDQPLLAYAELVEALMPTNLSWETLDECYNDDVLIRDEEFRADYWSYSY